MNSTFKNLINNTQTPARPASAVSKLEAAIMRDVESSVTAAHPLASYIALKPDDKKAKAYVSVRVTESSEALEQIYKDATQKEPTVSMAQNVRSKCDQMLILEILAGKNPELKKLIDKAEFIATRRAEVNQILELTEKSLEDYLS